MNNIQEIIDQLQDAAGSRRDLKIFLQGGNTVILKSGAIFLSVNDDYPIKPVPLEMPHSEKECQKQGIYVIVVVGWTMDLKKELRIYSSEIVSISLI
jgi:hypothetical protein